MDPRQASLLLKMLDSPGNVAVGGGQVSANVPLSFEKRGEADAWGKKAFSQWAASLTPEEQFGIKAYVGGGYDQINAAVRSGKPLDQAGGKTAHVVQGLDSALDKGLAPQDLLVHRGIRGEFADKMLALAQQGGQFADPTFLSTGVASKAMDFHSRDDQGGTSAILDINVPKGTRGAYVDAFDQGGESEFLMPRSTTLQFHGAEQEADGRWRIKASVVGQKEAAKLASGGTASAPAGFQPQGTDTVPAMLTPGEEVVPRDAAEANRPLLKQIEQAHGPVASGALGRLEHLASGGTAGGGGGRTAGPSSGEQDTLRLLGQLNQLGLSNLFVDGPVNVQGNPVNVQGGPGGTTAGGTTPSGIGSSPKPPAPPPIKLPAPVGLPAGLDPKSLNKISDPLFRLGSELSRLMSGLKDMGGAFRDLSARSTVAFGAATVSMAGLVQQASPTVWRTFTGSMQLLSAQIGSSLIGPITLLSAKLQDAARWVGALDPKLKAQIGTWAGWGVGALGAVTILGRIAGAVGNLAPLLGGLASPLGLVGAGLAALAVFNPEVFSEVGKALLEMGKGLGEALLPVLQGVASGLQNLVQWLGPTGVQFLALGTAVALVATRIGPIAGIMTAIAPLLAKMSPAGAIATLALVGVGAALLKLPSIINAVKGEWLALRTAFLANPFGMLVGGAGLVIGALAAIGHAFGDAAEKVDRLINKMSEEEELIKRLEGGGNVTMKELRKTGAINAEQEKELAGLKPEQRPARLKEMAEQADKEAKAADNPERQGRIAAAINKHLKEGAGGIPEFSRSGFGKFLFGAADYTPVGRKTKEMFSQSLAASIAPSIEAEGVNKEDAAKAAQLIADKMIDAVGKGLSGADLDKEIESAIKIPGADSTALKARAATLKKAVETGLDPITGKTPLSPLEKARGDIMKLRERYLRAYPTGLSAQYVAPESIRELNQAAHNNTDPFQRAIEQMDRNNSEGQQKLLDELEVIKQNTFGRGL